MKDIIEKLYNKENLSFDETKTIFEEIFAGKLDPIVFSSVLTAMKIKGYCSDELGGAANAMISAALPFNRNRDICVGEIVGTGGDKLKTINISTISAIVCASLGLHVAKHGNTAVSSKSGASDVLTQLGYNIRAEQKDTLRALEEQGFAFFFAQKYHTGMKYAAPVRKALGTSTIFNILGPICNPAHVDYELLGCYDENLLEDMSLALKLNNVKRAMVINGNGMDEISIFGQTKVCELLENGDTRKYTLTNEDFGIKGNYTQSDLTGGDAVENAKTAKQILSGKGCDAHNAVIAANTSAMLYLAGKTDNFKSGFEMALEEIKSGRALNRFEKIAKISMGL